MPDQRIFCNTPWYEIHIYWDGSLGICCQEAHKLYDVQEERFNIKHMPLMEWFNSEPVRQLREDLLLHDPISACDRCYQAEMHGGDSRRYRSNMKSVIFTRSAFADSYLQSPGNQHFEYSRSNSGHTLSYPIDLHVDLGNFCNLACKMCNAQASSTIAAQQVKWGIENARQYVGQDWTKDDHTWNSFKHQLLNIPTLNNIHFMGGETLLTRKLEDLIDTFIAHERFDLCFSFVTNGTVYRPELLEKLSRFRRVGIEISLETTTEHNAYTRQGTDTQHVLDNIQRYQQWCNGSSITITLRPAPSILTIGNFVSLLEYALEKRLVVKSNICVSPAFLDARILPKKIKAIYQDRFRRFLEQNVFPAADRDYNSSDPNNYQTTIKQHAELCLALLEAHTPTTSAMLLREMVEHCSRWDAVYQLDARTLYPEWQEIFDEYGYADLQNRYTV